MNFEIQLVSVYYNVCIGGDMVLFKGMMCLLIECDDVVSVVGWFLLFDDEFI